MYLLYFFKTEYFVKEATFSGTAGQQRVRMDYICNKLFPLPPLEEQQRIVENINRLMLIADRYEKSQDTLDKLNATLPEQLRKSILQEAIQGKLTPQNANDEPASKLLERIRTEKQDLLKAGTLKKKDTTDSVIFRGDDNRYYEKVSGKVTCIDEEIPFEIPENWEWVRLGDVISLLSGRDLQPNEYNAENRGIPYITGASNILSGVIIVNRWTDSPMTVSHKGDLLITCKGTVGAMAFNIIGDVHIARQVMAIRPYIIEPNYVKQFLASYILILQKKAKSMIPGISREDVLDAIIPLPPLKEQLRIVNKIDALFQMLK
jgi:type I restriction enzyme S subunit